MQAKYGSVPFKEAIDFYRNKLRLPTQSWTDIWEGQHSSAFVVAGAMRDELLADLQAAIGKGIADGTTIEQFRKEFDQIVAKHGWAYKGGRNWRTRVIYDTNLRQAYNAGRERQMQNPELRKRRPYGLYIHSDTVEHPRPLHESWHNLVLPLDDPWWETHTPQNGWGCQCQKFMLNDRDLKRRGLKVGKAPPINWVTKVVGKNGPNPRTVRVPEGIDPGFGYNPGIAAWGQPLAEKAMAEWQAQKGKAWTSLNPETWAEFGRPERMPLAKALELGERLIEEAAVIREIKRVIGGKSKLYKPGKLPVHVDAEVLGKHIDPARAEYLTMLDDMLSDPYEVWLAFQQHRGTGQVVLRSRIIKAYDIGNGRYLLMVATVKNGMLEGWTFIPTRNLKYINRQRQGMLIYGKDD